MRTHPIAPAELAWTTAADGTPLPTAPAFGDVYHAAAGAFAQAQHVFIAGNGLPGRWAARDRFVILETGFGLGNTFLATWAAWRDDPARCERLVFVSLDKHPPRQADLRRAHAASQAPELARQLVEAWPLLTPNLHTLTFEAGRVQLILGWGDIADLLPALVLQADAFYLDGFAPAKNPDMWAGPLLQRLGRLAAPGATAATWSAARGVRDALATAGFVVTLHQGFAGKRDMTVARFEPRHQAAAPAGGLLKPACERHAMVIGAGLAGCAAAWALSEQGWTSTLLDQADGPAQAASGNAGGLFHAIVHGEDGIHARSHRAAALATAALVAPWLRDGRLPGSDAGLLRLDRRTGDAPAAALLQRQGWPAEALQWLSEDEARARSGLPVPSGGWWFGQAGWLSPAGYAQALLQACGARFIGRSRVARLERRRHLWAALDAQGRCLAEAPVVVVATAHQAAELLRPWTDAPLPLVAVRGQVSLLPAGTPGVTLPRHPVAGAGYALALPDGRLVCGATTQHDDADPAVRAADHEHNLAQAVRLGALHADAVPAALAAAQGRVGWRAVTPDRLPLIGAVPLLPPPGTRADQPRLIPRLRDEHGGLFVLTGLGSRGLTWAALAGRLLASWVTGSPCPVEADLRDALDVGRWVARRPHP
jgi:tRNA 5-methylaminomethyl-2-thiouridine biosynthesis bifunctional protein